MYSDFKKELTVSDQTYLVIDSTIQEGALKNDD